MGKELFVITKNYKNLDHGLESSYIQDYQKIPEDAKTSENIIKMKLNLPLIDGDQLNKENVEVNYQTYEVKKNDKWILFVNGFTSSVNLWNFQKGEFLRNGYNVITFDLLGQGKSSKPEGVKYTVESQVEIIEKLVEESSLKNNKFCLMAISAGGMIAQAYASKHQRKLEAMVLIATSPKVDGSLEFSNELMKKMLTNSHLTDKEKKELLVHYVMFTLFSDNLCRQHRVIIDQLMESNINRNTVGCILGALYTQEEFDSTSYLPNINIPTFILVGMHDKIIDTHHSYSLSQLLPNSQRFVFKGVNASHAFLLEIFEVVNELIINELNSVNAFKGSKVPTYIENVYVQEKPSNEMIEIHL